MTASAAAGEFTLSGVVAEPEITEISGIAASRARPGLLWVVNDSGNQPVLFGIGHDGKLLQRVVVRGAQNHDWEDLAWFERDGRAYLAIGDIGNNFGLLRASADIYIVPEPGPGVAEVAVVRALRFVYPGQPRDAEALAVDVVAGQILIMEKGPAGAGLYQVALDGPDTVQTAQRLTPLAGLWPWPAAPIAPIGAQQGRGAATAMDLSADGKRLLVLTYAHLFVFERAPGEAWDLTLTRTPVTDTLPGNRHGFESACFDRDDRSIWVVDEGAQAHLYRHR